MKRFAWASFAFLTVSLPLVLWVHPVADVLGPGWVGHYRIEGALGWGGMAQVYRGVHESLQREVAIKELLPESLKDKETVSRFRREALALAALPGFSL